RLLNAANARTLRIAFRTAGGSLFPFTLIGNDGGLLSAPIRAEQAFLATAERIDLLLDLRDAQVGDALRMESLAFAQMYAKGAEAAPSEHQAMSVGATSKAGDHEYAHRWPEGVSRTLLELRVRRRIRYDRTVPQRLSELSPLDVTAANERSFRLG